MQSGDGGAGPTPHASSGSATFSQTAEVQLFRGWSASESEEEQPFARDAEEHLEEWLLSREEDANGSCATRSCSPALAGAPPAPEEAWLHPLTPGQGIVASHLKRVRWGGLAPASPSPSFPEATLEASGSNMMAWATSIEALQASLKVRMATLPSRHHATLQQQIMDSGRELCLEPQRRWRPSCRRFLHAGDGRHMLHGELEELQAEGRAWEEALSGTADDFARQLCREPHRQGAAACTRFLPEADGETSALLEGHTWETAFLERARGPGRELCLDPRRRGYAACGQFVSWPSAGGAETPWAQELLALQATLDAAISASPRVRRLAATAKSKAFVEEVSAYGRELCSDPARSGYKACKQFLEEEEKPLSEQIEDLGHELCSNPRRQGYASCGQFLAGSPGRALADEAMAYGRELCLDPARSGYGACQQFLDDEKPLAERIEHLGREMCLDPRRRGHASCHHFLDRRAEFVGRFDELRAKERAWDGAFAAQVSAAVRELCADPQRRGSEACRRLFGSERGLRAWESSLSDEVAAYGQELCSDPARSGYAACEQFPLDQDKPLLEQIQDFGRELCSNPRRQGYDSCRQFLVGGPEHTDRGAWQAALANEARAYGRDLCLDPSRSGYEACGQFLREERPLLERIADLGREMCLEPHRRGRAGCDEILDRRAEFDGRFRDLAAEDRAWDKAFGARISAATHELCADPQRQGSEACRRLPRSDDGPRAWERSLTEEATAYGRELCLDPARSGYAACGQFLGEEESLSEQIQDLGREMCLDPSRQGYDSCKQFLADPALTDEARAYGRELCLDPARSGYEACGQFLREEEKPLLEKPLLERIADLGREMCLEPHRRGRAGCDEILDRRAEFDGRFRDLEAEERVWDEAFGARASAAARALCADPQRQGSEACRRLLDSVRAPRSWEMSLSEDAATYGRELCLDPARSGYAACRQFLGEEKPLLEQIKDLGRELCSDPRRRGYAACEQFLEEDAGRHHSEWEKALSEETRAFGRELCLEPFRSGYSACQQFLDGGKPLLEQIKGLGRELCLEPHRHLRAGCDEFLDRRAMFERHFEEMTGEQRARDTAFTERVSTAARELCAEPDREGSEACRRLLG